MLQADVALFCLPVNAHREVIERITPNLKKKFAPRYAFGQLESRDFASFMTMRACFDHTKLYLEHTFDIAGIS